MSDARRYAVWPAPRSRSWALQSWKSDRFQQLSPALFTMGAGNWPSILKLGHNIYFCYGWIFYIWPSFCVTWLWSWQKRQLWRVDRQSHMGLIYLWGDLARLSKCHWHNKVGSSRKLKKSSKVLQNRVVSTSL